jgi:leader peptidase (prepilin peptidase)/N-methyltransferase
LPLWGTVIATLGIAGWTMLVMPHGVLVPATLVLGWALLVLAIIDALVFRLPDVLTLPLAVLGLAVTAWTDRSDLLDHAAGAALGFAVLAGIAWLYHWVRGKHGLGLGDAKLAAAAGAWLGALNLPIVVLFAAIGGLVLAGVAAIRRGQSALAEPVPFGVPLSLAIWLVWLYGPIAETSLFPVF